MKIHTILYVRDQQRATEFYTTVLGASPGLNVPGMTEFHLSDTHVLGLMPEAGIKRLLGENLPDPSPANGIPRAEIYLRVDDPERHHSLALASGAKELSPFKMRNWGDLAAYSLDLDGHVLVFAKTPPLKSDVNATTDSDQNVGQKIVMTPVGRVHSSRKDIADDNWDAEDAYIQIESGQFSSESLSGLSEFSHVEILFYMDKVDPTKVERTARHPRNNQDWPKVGIFAQRGKNRPNQIGSTVCRVLKVEGLKLHLEGLDAIHETPVLDIKPCVEEFSPRGRIFQPQWITELMKGYWQS